MWPTEPKMFIHYLSRKKLMEELEQDIGVGVNTHMQLSLLLWSSSLWVVQ